MSRPDLFAEFAPSNGRLTRKYFEHLVDRLGVDPSCIWGVGPSFIGVESVHKIERKYYQPDENGRPCYICPVGRHVDGVWETIDDLVAWTPSQPDRWYLRTGNGVMLNPDEPERCRIHHEPIELHETPLDWLRAAGRGAVVLDWSANLRLLLGSLSDVVCSTPDLARRISNSLKDRNSLPKIHIRRESLDVAA